MPETGQTNATCAICGYLHPGGNLPENCPQCGSIRPWRGDKGDSPSDAPEDKPSIWRCKECGFIHYGTQPPEFCPVCGYPASQFEPLRKRKTFIS